MIMHRIKTLVLVFVTATVFSLLVPATHARIGDTEEQAKSENAVYDLEESPIDNRAKMLVFTNVYERRQHAVAILDGKVEYEIWTRLDDAKPDKEFVLTTIHSYSEVWLPVSCADDCVAVVSSDLKYFAMIGPAKSLRKRNVFEVWSENWHAYCKSQRKGEKV
jgi:hypothetical protein